MKSKIVKKNLKPIEYDVHLKYICQQCGNSHWLSFAEASTKCFKIVCDCGSIFGVKRVNRFKLQYYKKKPIIKQTPQPQPVVVTETKAVEHTIAAELLHQTVDVLKPYGFTDSEAKELATQSYKNSPTDSVVSLVKQILESLRKENVN